MVRRGLDWHRGPTRAADNDSGEGLFALRASLRASTFSVAVCSLVCALCAFGADERKRLRLSDASSA